MDIVLQSGGFAAPATDRAYMSDPAPPAQSHPLPPPAQLTRAAPLEAVSGPDVKRVPRARCRQRIYTAQALI
ncbi:hypothetical protein E5D57_010923 [Metarhizium anisopliae]|nr:hypothetical protein E5D57_010923 [Metarhizium anisopliae]